MRVRNAVTFLGRAAAPLVVGYAWLFFAWLAVRPLLPKPTDAKDTLGTVYEVVSTLGKYLGLVVGSVLAYMIGWLTIRLLLVLLAALPAPEDGRTMYLRWPELTDGAPSYSNFRAVSTKPYVLQGILPAELYRDNRFPDEFRRLCTEIQFFWAIPAPLFAGGLYLTVSLSVFFLVPTLLTPLLMWMGYGRFTFACRLLSQAAVDHAIQMHDEAAQAWAATRVPVS
jgi:hypothetical protein